jgi:pimeloyl-ACP methyl ester carboxylesterase
MEQQRITLASRIELDVVDVGPRDAPVLIFLHGFPESHRTWRHQVAHLSARYRCIAPDQRGYRGSSKPEGVENYTPDKLIGDIFLLADALGVDKFTVLGHDWGGAIAWGVALMGQGTRVTRAVIANAPHPGVFRSCSISIPSSARPANTCAPSAIGRTTRWCANMALPRC